MGPLVLFWYAALLDILGPFADYYYPPSWGLYLWLLGAWQGLLHLPFPQYAPSLGFDVVASGSFLLSAAFWLWRSRSFRSAAFFVAFNLFLFEMLMLAVLPGEMLNHVMDSLVWKVGRFYIVSNLLVLSAASAVLGVVLWKR